jgi:hypothetical protein
VLSGGTRAAIALLVGFRDALVPAAGRAVWLQHYESADRAWHLADHLNRPLDDTDRVRSASAFGTLRTGMWHELADRLLLLAERYFVDVEEADEEQFVAVEERTADMPDVVSVERRGNRARLVRNGHDIQNADGEVARRTFEDARVRVSW